MVSTTTKGPTLCLSNNTIANGNNYGRDIGRSTELSDGTVLIQLGDTFSNDHEGNFIGSSTNTCAVTANLECPTISSYKLYEGEEEAHELIKLMRMQGEDPTPNHQYSMYIR